MKTFRLLGMALLAVFMCVGFTACGDDDDDSNGGVVASIEGTWYLKAEIWYAWENGQPVMNIVTKQKSYADYYKGRIWNFKKNGETWVLGKKTEKDDDFNYNNLTKVGNNEFSMGESDRFIIRSVTANTLVVDYYDNYYNDDDSYKEYGVYTFMR